MVNQAGDIDVALLDLDRHDLGGLRTDVAEIFDLPGAVSQTLKWTVLVPLIGTYFIWGEFDERMSRWFLVPYIVLIIAALFVAAIALGVFFVLRNRVAVVNKAADRVIVTVAALHGDYLKVKAGEATVPTRQLAVIIAREIVFPALRSGSSTALQAATIVSGPAGFITRHLIGRLTGAVEQVVADAMENVALPEDRDTPEVVEPPLIDGADLVTAMLIASVPIDVGEWYVDIHRHLSRVVGGTGDAAVWSFGTLLAIAVVPLSLLLLLGWALT